MKREGSFGSSVGRHIKALVLVLEDKGVLNYEEFLNEVKRLEQEDQKEEE